MEFFPDGALIRLRSRVRGEYLVADEDGTGVFLSPVRGSLNAVWRVHRVVRDDVAFVLLHGAAYYRYLAASDDEPSRTGHRGQLMAVVKGVYDHPAENAVIWTVIEAEDGDYVLMQHISGRLLRANGNHGLTVDHPDNRGTMMHWVVEAIPLLPDTPDLPLEDQRAAKMELFPDGALVRLRSRVRRDYLYADEDGTGVFLSPVRQSLNAAWQVHWVFRDDVPFVLPLHSAAYDRYLAALDEPAPRGHRGQLVVQGVYDHPGENADVWTVVDADDGGYVLLQHISGRLLRANGNYRNWNNAVTVDHPDNRSTMMHWVVEAIVPLLPEALDEVHLHVPQVSSPITSLWFYLHLFGLGVLRTTSIVLCARTDKSEDFIPLGTIPEPRYFAKALASDSNIINHLNSSC
jgi:hypothetical protein